MPQDTTTTVHVSEPYPDGGQEVTARTGDETLRIRIDRGNVEETVSAVFDALLAAGVRGDYRNLAEAVQTLQARAEAAEAVEGEADPDDVVIDVVRVLQAEISGTPEEIAVAAVRLRQMLLRRYRLIPLGD